MKTNQCSGRTWTISIFLLYLTAYVHCADPIGTNGCTEDIEDDEYCMGDIKNSIAKCSLTPQSYEGPFFLPNMPIRTDIREGKPGIPLKIKILVKNKTCLPLKDADVHLWHSDAIGMYSAYSGYYPIGDPSSKQIMDPHAEPTEKGTFLRGIQKTDDNGVVDFLTIYPGWYQVRSLHIHLKITINGVSKYTGEIYFPDELTDEVMKVEPYSQHPGRRLNNEQDPQFIDDHGVEMILRPTGNAKDGFDGKMQLVLNV